MHRPLRHLFAAGLAIAVVASGAARMAQAVPAARGASPAAALHATLDSALTWQEGALSAQDLGYGTIWDWQTNRCLDSNYWGNVYTLPCNGGNYQNWTVTGGTPNYDPTSPVVVSNAQIVNHQTGLCLADTETGEVYAAFCSVLWSPDPTTYWTITDLVGVPTISSNWTGQCLDSDYNGNVYPLPCNGGNYQYWYGV